MEPEPLSTVFYLELTFFLFALFACAILSFLETSVTALRLFKLKELASSTSRYKSLLATLEKNPQQVLITILIANSIADVAAAALITNMMERLFASMNLSTGLGFSLGIGIGSAALIIFGEIIPKNLARAEGERIFKSTLWITNVLFYTLYPLVNILIRFSNRLVGIFSKMPEQVEAAITEHEIKFLIDYIDEKGLMEKEKTAMLQSIFNLGLKPVKEIMIPAIDIVMINAEASIKNALELYAKYQFSRLPVYENNQDNVIGMIHQKDIFILLSKNQDRPLRELIRPILFVPESMKINQLLREFMQQRFHMAIVINEYGSITGLVTLEDVLEEIVGEIRDEYEEVTEKIVSLEEGSWLVDASIDLDTLSEKLTITFDVEDAITLGGFLTEQLQHVPKKGERITYKGYYFQVQKASHKRVFHVLIFKDTNQALID